MQDWYGEEEKKEREGTSLVQNTGKSDVPNKNSWIIAGAILLASFIVSGAILVSKNSFFRSAGNTDTVGTALAGNTQPTAAPVQPSGPVKVSVDDDPVLGNPKAPVTLIEFSDYECPFCKRTFEQLLPELKKTYIDTGKVKLVYRDFPLSFHANAEKEAEAAQCAKDQGGDTAYYKFHDQIFTKTTSNGTGLALTELSVIAKNIGLDGNKLQQCLDSGKFKDEVAKDIADGTKAGVSGTPSWIVGKSSKDGLIEGSLVVGAQPFAAFQTVIEEQLKK